MWPRGLPFSSSKQRTDPTIGKTSCYPIVQQYLAQSNPDVDPHYYMHSNVPQSLNTSAPALVIPRGVFSPYNSQATVHLYEALWSLLLPRTVEMRDADILRSYIAQSLFYLIPDACLMFTPPAVTVGARKSLNNGDLPHINTSHVVRILKYHLMSFDTFEQALLGTYKLMYESQILGEEDIILMENWIGDLKSVGYVFPKLPKTASLWTKNVHLCIMFNWGSTEYRTRLLLAYYMRFFDVITLFFEGESKISTYIPSHIEVFHVSTEHGHYQQRSLELCLKRFVTNVTSHLYIADDMFINITKMSQLSLSKIWFIPMSEHTFGGDSILGDNWSWWRHPPGNTFYSRFVTVVNSLPQELKQILIDKVGFPNRIHGHAAADIIHIPHSYAANVTKVLDHISSVAELFCELAVPLAVDIAQPTGREEMGDNYLWSDDRDNPSIVQRFVDTGYYAHPLKMSTRFAADMWCRSMNNQIRLLAYY